MMRSRSVMTLAHITAIFALLAMACSSSSIPVASVSPTTTISTVEPRSTFEANLTTPQPDPVDTESALIAPLSVSLQPIALDEWDSPLIVSGKRNANQSGPILNDGEIFISWAVTNKGPDSANSPFSIDLLLDGVPIERWKSKGLFVDEVQSVRDWSVLPSRTRLDEGVHSLTLVVDPTGFVQTRRNDWNTTTVTFDWTQSPIASSNGGVAPDRLPNLSLFIPPDWEDPIQLEGLPSKKEALANPRDPRIQIAYHNSGLSSISRLFLVQMRLDNVLITKFSQQGLVSDGAVVTSPWRELLDTIHISIGFHTLTVELDPTNLVKETDESDNFASLRFFWGGEPPTSVQPSPINETTRHNIAEYTPTGWSSSLIVTSYPGRTGALSPVYRDGDSFVSWAITNDGTQDFDSPYTIDLLLGGSLIQSWSRPGLEAGGIDVVVDELLQVAPNPGVYEMLLRLQPESSEENPINATQIISRSVGWLSGESPPAATELLEPGDLSRRLTVIESLRSSTTPATDSEAHLGALHTVVDAVYQTLYQVSLRDEPLAINILTDAEFEHWVDAECGDIAPTLNPSVQSLYLARCEATKGFIGYHTSWRGAFRIVVKGDRSPMQVLSTIAHELGHFRQSSTNPDLDNRANINVLALREAQAYAHQVLFFRTLEGLTGLDLLLYPELPGYETYIETQLVDLRQNSATNEHARGQLVLWLALLADPNLRQERTILLNNLSIPADTAEDLFNYLVEFSPGEARLYVAVLMRSIGAQIGAMEDLALARLVQGLPYWIEGSPHLREIGLLMP
jgi:hypothetical protein